MSIAPRVGVRDNYSSGDIMDYAEWNHLARYLDGAIAKGFMEKMTGDGVITADPNSLTFDTSTNRFSAPDSGNPVIGVIGGQFFYMTSDHEKSGTAQSGSTTSLKDTSLTEADGYWKYAYVVFTSGANSGEVREVDGFDSSTTTLTWTTPLSTAVSNGDTYVVTFFYIQNLTNGSTNYIFARAGNSTSYAQVVQWIATTSFSPLSNDLYVAKVVLDGSGNATSVDNNPDGADRTLYVGMGEHHIITLSGTLLNVPAGGEVEVTRSHAYLLFRGGIRYSLGSSDFTFQVTEHWKPDEIKFVITNNSGYTKTCTYTVYVEGRKRQYSNEVS